MGLLALFLLCCSVLTQKDVLSRESAIFLEQQGKLDMGFLDPCKGCYKYTDDARICEHSHNLRVSHKIGCHTPTAAAIRLGADILRAMPSQDI